MKTAASRKSGSRAVRAKGKRGRTREYAGVLSLAATAADSLDGILRKIDGEVFRELKAIAAHIGTLRKEIAKLPPRKMQRQSIPAAGQELDAIVTATEAASERILECAEQVMAADARDPARYKAFVDARMTSIFEACEFQDLTGQRIARVVDTLKQIEARVAPFANPARPARRVPAGKAKPSGNSQEAIDRMFGTGAARR